jgi:hypothetical protein
MARYFSICAIAIVVAFNSCSASGQKSDTELKRSLTRQSFSGMLEGNVHFTELGVFDCQSKAVRVIYYEWNESNPPGKAIHASYRVILMTGNSYMGSYAIEDKPTVVNGKAIVFPYSPAEGNVIVCGVGGLPQEVLLNGENLELAK